MIERLSPRTARARFLPIAAQYREDRRYDGQIISWTCGLINHEWTRKPTERKEKNRGAGYAIAADIRASSRSRDSRPAREL